VAVVVDASAALQAASAPTALEQLAQHDPVAPPLMWSEALSALHEARWRGQASPRLAERVRAQLLGAPIVRSAPDGLFDESWRVADTLGWATTYDAEYVALARLLECPLVTIDARLRRAAARLVGVLGPTEL
jgi:predicted nucleic acid-binding protein